MKNVNNRHPINIGGVHPTLLSSIMQHAAKNRKRMWVKDYEATMDYLAIARLPGLLLLTVNRVISKIVASGPTWLPLKAYRNSNAVVERLTHATASKIVL
jgi:hypothetical protein